MKKIVRKSTIPLYAVAVTWLLYALLFPLYRPFHFVVAAAAGAVVGLISRGLCKDIVEEVPEPEPEPETTGNEELDKMLADGAAAIAEMKRLDDNIDDAKISADIVRLETVSSRIFEQVKANPKKLPQIRKFMNYYLPTTLKLLKSYSLMEKQSYQGENIQSSRKKIEDVLDTLIRAFEQQQDRLFRTEALDVEADISVLETMMASDGLLEQQGGGLRAGGGAKG